MLEIKNLTKHYDDFSLTLDFSINKGEIVSILGPSGSGKSTILKLISGLIKPNSGEIINNNIDITKLTPYDRKIGLIFQDYTLFPHLNVYKNISFGLENNKNIIKSNISNQVLKQLKLINLKGYEKRSISTLSGGEQQRVAIARALIMEPQILLLDEPFSSIDSILRRNLRKEILEIQHRYNITTIFVTHSQEEALSISDKIVVLNNGKIQQIGTPEDLYKKPKNKFVAEFIADINIFDTNCEETNILFKKYSLKRNKYILVRPNNIETNHGKNEFVIINREFLGNTYRYEAIYNSKKIIFYNSEKYNINQRINFEITNIDNIVNE